jgi:hypothetical protein
MLRKFMNCIGFPEQHPLFVLFAVPFNVNHTTLQKYCKWMLFSQLNTFLTCADHLPFVTCNVWLIASPTFRRLRWGLYWAAEPYKMRPVLRDVIKWTVCFIDCFYTLQCSWQLRTVWRDCMKSESRVTAFFSDDFTIFCNCLFYYPIFCIAW